jgi:hypothetical protein
MTKRQAKDPTTRQLGAERAHAHSLRSQLKLSQETLAVARGILQRVANNDPESADLAKEFLDQYPSS